MKGNKIASVTCLILLYFTFSHFSTPKRQYKLVYSPKDGRIYGSFLLPLSTRQFETIHPFTKFVSHVLSHRDDSTALQALDFHRASIVEAYLLKKIVKYAVSHSVQQLQISVDADFQRFPPCFFSCNTLTSLKLSLGYNTLFPNFLNLPALTSLSLRSFVFHNSDDGRVEPFSKFKMLNSLIIDSCMVGDAQNLCISSPKLVSLTILQSYFGIELSVPSLHTFTFTGCTILNKIYGSKSNLSTIKHVNIDLASDWEWAKTSSALLRWLSEFAGIESLTVSLDALKVLSLVPELSKVELPSLYNLKLLKGGRFGRSSVPGRIVDFLLQNSPSAKVNVITYSGHKFLWG